MRDKVNIKNAYIIYIKFDKGARDNSFFKLNYHHYDFKIKLYEVYQCYLRGSCRIVICGSLEISKTIKEKILADKPACCIVKKQKTGCKSFMDKKIVGERNSSFIER